jgi:glycerate 2-kinase
MRPVEDIFYVGLRAVDPYEAVRAHLDRLLSFYKNGGFTKLYLVGFGKAAHGMAKALTENAPGLITKGILVTKYGHSRGVLSENVEIFEAGHPVPDNNGFIATRRIIDMLRQADRQTLVVCLISGGGSALLVSPYNGITLEEKQEATRLLLMAGADINEMNTVRKHLSLVKGGRLAELAFPAGVVSLILSDVIGDPLDVIASGPTSPDTTTYKDAAHVIDKYGLGDRIPRSVSELLRQGCEGIVPETPKQGNPLFDRVENIIVGSNKKATGAARQRALELGFDATILSNELQGEARVAAKQLADKAKGVRSGGRPVCLIAGGETTVTVKGNGLGGRNTEMALAFAVEIDGLEGITFLSAGTDGTDGPTDAAGAIVDGTTISSARRLGLDPHAYLANNDSYTFFKETGGLLITGPTGTNVMDIQVVLVGA